MYLMEFIKCILQALGPYFSFFLVSYFFDLVDNI